MWRELYDDRGLQPHLSNRRVTSQCHPLKVWNAEQVPGIHLGQSACHGQCIQGEWVGKDSQEADPGLVTPVGEFRNTYTLGWRLIIF